MPLFDIPKRSDKNNDVQLAKKSKITSKSTKTVKGGIAGVIEAIVVNVERNLGNYKDKFIIIQDEQELRQYLEECKELSIDTETTGLNPMLDSIVGASIYCPGHKAAYIPINHKSHITGVRKENQLTADEFGSILQEALDKYHPFIYMFNAQFDIRVLKHQAGVNIWCDWDGVLAAKIMNENEEHKLKVLYSKYVMKDKSQAFLFTEFSGVTFDYIPISSAYLYAANDALITYELAEWQKQYIYYDADEDMDARNGMNGASWVFFNIEMPCVEVVVQLEDNGICIDLEYQKVLSEKYNKMLEDKQHEIDSILQQPEFAEPIMAYRNKMGEACKLDIPINVGSPTQLAILLYDVLKTPPVDKKSPRGTGEEILEKINNPICRAILDYRGLAKLVGTYIDKLPNCINPNDGRIHASFNQYGARTGRFSSSDPNLQNIPSRNHDIRKMFVASPGYVLMSSDYSQQEPKVMTQMCQDPKMIQAYKEGKDLYAEIAALSFNTTYENCLEFRPDGTTNPEGKNRRSQAKSILLGVLYGRGVPSIAEQLGTSTKKAQAIKDSVFKGFPAIPKFERDSVNMAYEKGYVTTLWGRKRRLPDLQLPEYEFYWKDGGPLDEDLFAFDDMNAPVSQEVPDEKIDYYWSKLDNANFRDKAKIKKEALDEGIVIVDNGGKIADAERQCVNSRIQGSAADMTKLAMILLGNNERLKELGFRMLIQVHDELIAECPKENVKECKKLFADLMSKAAQSRLEIPISCDVAITDKWYGEELSI